MKKLLVISVLSVVIFATGCSMDVTLEQLSEVTAPITNLIQKSRMSGLTSGSTQTGTATGSDGVTYSVQTTVGSYMSAMEQTTDDNSYKVYSSVQGGLVTE